MSENINLQNEEENIIIATFKIIEANTEITLQNLEGMTEIDWGYGVVDNNLTHIYTSTGNYVCKIYGVTSIGGSAFKDCSSLTSVAIGDGVTNIGGLAFYGCSSLTNVVIPDSVTSIGNYAFRDCDNLTSVTIGNSVTSIGEYAFCGCYSLESIVIPDSVTSIGDSAFNNCIRLTSVVIPGSVTSINSSAFSYCIRLTSIEIPDSVTSIGSWAFRYCNGLTSVTIPDSVTSIGTWAFDRCSSLTSIRFKSENPLSVEIIANSGINNTTPTYYVPTNSVKTYRTAWTGVVAEEQIQPDPGERLITLDGLKTYHNTLKEKYLHSMATQTWVQEQLVGKTDYLGTVTDTPNFPDAGAGDYCRVSTEFTYNIVDGEVAHVGDILIAVKDSPTQSIADWDLVHTELNSATMVTVGGEAQVNWEADTKLDKVTTTYGNNVHRLYAIGSQGQQYVITTTDSNNVVATQDYADKKIINLNAADILTNQDVAAFITLTKDILDGKCNVFVKLNDAVGALVTEVYYSETNCQWRVFGQASKAFHTLTAAIDGEKQSITLEEESLGSILVQFMTIYLNSEETAANKPTAADISTVFNEEEEA